MQPPAASLLGLRDEATALFAGRDGVLGVAVAPAGRLAILLAAPAPAREGLIREWAIRRAVPVDFVVTGLLRATSKSPA